MTRIQFLHDLLPVIAPRFYTVFDDLDNEFVLLDEGHKLGKKKKASSRRTVGVISDKTQFEALENHVHIFGKVKSEQSELAKEIGVRIAENLARSVRACYPEKEFIIYLTFDPKDSTIVRFHQIWNDEPIYYDYSEDAFGGKVFRF